MAVKTDYSLRASKTGYKPNWTATEVMIGSGHRRDGVGMAAPRRQRQLTAGTAAPLAKRLGKTAPESTNAIYHWVWPVKFKITPPDPTPPSSWIVSQASPFITEKGLVMDGMDMPLMAGSMRLGYSK